MSRPVERFLPVWLNCGLANLLFLLVPQVAGLVVEVHLGVVDPLLGAAGEPDGVRVDVSLQLIGQSRRPSSWIPANRGWSANIDSATHYVCIPWYA